MPSYSKGIFHEFSQFTQNTEKYFVNEEDLIGEHEFCEICHTTVPIEMIFRHIEICREKVVTPYTCLVSY